MLTGKVKYQEESIKTLDNLTSYKHLIFLTSAQNTPSHQPTPKKSQKKYNPLAVWEKEKEKEREKERWGRDGSRGRGRERGRETD